MLRLCDFLDVAYTLQVQEMTRMGVGLLDALARLRASAQGSLRDLTVDRSEAALDRMNERSLRQLTARLGTTTFRGPRG